MKQKKLNSALLKIGTAMENRKTKIKTWGYFLTTMILTAPATVFADVDAEASWNLVMNFLLTWIPRLGGVLLFLGGVEFAIAYKNEDANAKTNATRLMIAGAMVIAIPVALKSLLISG